MPITFADAVVLPGNATQPYHAVPKAQLDAGLAGPPSAHATTHEAGGSDPLLSVVDTAHTANYTLVDADEIVPFNTTSALTATLPTAVGRTGKRFLIKKIGPVVSNTLTLATTSSQTIDGVATRVLTGVAAIEVVSDGANWQTIGGFGILPIAAAWTSPANGGTLTIDAAASPVARVGTGVAGFTLAAPTGFADTLQLNVEILPTVSFSLIIAGAILLTSGITTPIAVPANKKWFGGLRYSSTAWYLLASQVQS